MSYVLKVENLEVEFVLQQSSVAAVRNISFTIPQNKTVALVGESGSGKSVTAQSIMQILPKNSRISGGSTVLEGLTILRTFNCSVVTATELKVNAGKNI